MSLAHPWLLALLPLIPLLVFLRYGRRPGFRFSDGTTLARIRPSWTVRAAVGLPVLYGLGLAALVIALAHPRRGLRESIVRTEAVDIVLLVDVSSSMRALDLAGPEGQLDRLESAKQVISEFMAGRPNDRIGMIAFAAMPYAVAPLSLDHHWLDAQNRRLNTEMLEDGTAIGSAVASAVNHLRESEAKSKVVILLTDGENNAGTISPEDAAQAAKALGIKVYTVGAGTDGYVQVPVRSPFGGLQYRRVFSRIDETTLKEIARITDAAYFRARDRQGLSEVYAAIDELEKTEIDVHHYTQFEARFVPFAVAGMVLLGLEKLLSLGRLGRLPS